jgi:mono/diheme cytochrome c family protein
MAGVSSASSSRIVPGFALEERAALLAGLAEAVRGRLAPSDLGNVLAAAVGGDAGGRRLSESVRELVAAMNRAAQDEAQPLGSRRAAVGLLAFADYEQAGESLLGLLDPRHPATLQSAAVRALGSHRDDRVAAELLAPGRFATYTPSLREEVMSTLISQSRHVPALLDALEKGRVPAGAVDALRRRQLTQHRDGDIRRRAEAIFGSIAGDRAKVFESYKDVIGLASDPANGRAVFRRECASCHRLDREGSVVGPDLFGVRNQPKPAILLHILVPDQEITRGFAAYTVATKDGRVLTGLIASETPRASPCVSRSARRTPSSGLRSTNSPPAGSR